MIAVIFAVRPDFRPQGLVQIFELTGVVQQARLGPLQHKYPATVRFRGLMLCPASGLYLLGTAHGRCQIYGPEQ